MEALRYNGVSEKYTCILDNVYTKFTGTIINHRKSGKFAIRKGVQQVNTVSPKLFTVYLKEAFRKTLL